MDSFGVMNRKAVTFHANQVTMLANLFNSALKAPEPDRRMLTHYIDAMKQEMRQAAQARLVERIYGELMGGDYPEACARCQSVNLEDDQEWVCPYSNYKDCERADAADAAWELTR